MIDRPKKLPAYLYETASGTQPVREWILGLSAGEIDRAGHSEGRVRLAAGHAVLPQSRQWPVGSSQRSDGRQDRAGDFLHGAGAHGSAVGFIKKTRKTPAMDLKLALKRMKEVT